MNYRVGKQPCNEYKPQMEANEYHVWENAHQCYGFRQDKNGAPCDGTVSFCESCCCDHHSYGYETCGEKAVKEK